MITNQIIQSCIDAMKSITKVDFCVTDIEGNTTVSTFQQMEVTKEMIVGFSNSPADIQTIGAYHLFKVSDKRDIQYILISNGKQDEGLLMGKICVSQLQQLVLAYKEKYDVNIFFQNLVLDNILLVDIFNRAKKLRIEIEKPRAVFLIETKTDNKDSDSLEMLTSLFSSKSGDYVTAVNERNIILIKNVEDFGEGDSLKNTAEMIVDMMNTEAMLAVRVSFGNIVTELKEVSKSYKEAKMAMDVGKIFYMEKDVMEYAKLGIGRLIYQLPTSLCRMFIKEIFGDRLPEELDEEALMTIDRFFENNLNVSETSRQLFVHRNTLVYRLEKLEKAIGLDIRAFDDALVLKIALMVVNYVRYLDAKIEP